MGVVEIVIIIVAVLIVVAVVATAIVRKLKGKPSICSDCCGCPHARDCKSGDCRHCSTSSDKISEDKRCG